MYWRWHLVSSAPCSQAREPDGSHIRLQSPHTLKTTPWISNKQQWAHTVPSFCRPTFFKIRSGHGWTGCTAQPFSSQSCCSHVFRCQWGSWHLNEWQVIYSVGGRKENESSTAAAHRFSFITCNMPCSVLRYDLFFNVKTFFFSTLQKVLFFPVRHS